MSALGIIAIVLMGVLALILLISFLLLRFGVARKLPAFVLGKKKVGTGGQAQPTPWDAYMDQNRREIAWFDSLKPETVTITSFDGLQLCADYLPAENSDRTVLLINGYRSLGGKNDFGPVLRRYHELGYNILACEQRAHGRSEGCWIGFGIPERFDVRSWTQMLVKKYRPTAIFLHGISMGCSTVLMSTATGLPAQVKGVVADCGYTSPWDICKYQVEEQFHLTIFPFLYVTNWLDKMITNYSLREYSCLTAMQHNTLPILFIHGGKDTFVPTKMGKANYDACKAQKKWVCVEEAGHGMSFWIEPERTLREVEMFLGAL